MKNCLKCGASFVGSRKTQKYCSRKCNNARYKKNKELVKCPICKINFIPLRKISRFCSRKCSNLASSGRMTKKNYRHGMRETRFYTIWHGMMLRCLTSTSSSYEHYGAKGIKICRRWQEFINFYDDMYDSYLEHVAEFGEKQTTIDRINNKKGYSLNNCRWATWSIQAKNKLVERLRNKKGQYI